MYEYDKLLIRVQRVSSNHKYVIVGSVYKKKKTRSSRRCAYSLILVEEKKYTELFGQKNAVKTAKKIADNEHDSCDHKEVMAVLFDDYSGVGEVIWREE